MQQQTGEAARAGSVAALLNRGNHLMDRGELAAAIAAYRQVTTLAPQFGPAYRNLALAL
jgi:tetratricopeptide (TPR) repeat protein